MLATRRSSGLSSALLHFGSSRRGGAPPAGARAGLLRDTPQICSTSRTLAAIDGALLIAKESLCLRRPGVGQCQIGRILMNREIQRDVVGGAKPERWSAAGG